MEGEQEVCFDPVQCARPFRDSEALSETCREATSSLGIPPVQPWARRLTAGNPAGTDLSRGCLQVDQSRALLALSPGRPALSLCC